MLFANRHLKHIYKFARITQKNVLHLISFSVDDTLEIREVYKPNDERDPFPVLLQRRRLPLGMPEYITCSALLL